MKQALLCIAILLNALFSFGQQPFYRTYTWEAEPKLHQIDTSDAQFNFVKLLDKHVQDYEYEQSGELVMFETNHIIIHVNKPDGVEEVNKIYIPSGNILEEMDLKARVISPNGAIIPFDKSSVKHVDNLENSGPYIIFALSGIEPGCEIEYMYTNKRNPSLYSYIRIQESQPKRNVSVDFFSPRNLIYLAKGYNGCSEFVADTTSDGRNHLAMKMPFVKAWTEQKYATESANKMRYDYQLAYNTAKGKARLYSFETAGVDFYNRVYTFEKAELKAVEKLLSKLGITKLTTDSAKITQLEQWAKSHIGYKDGAESVPLQKMLTLNYSSDLDFQRFYVAAAEILKMPVELVLVGDRNKHRFDPSFSSYNSLHEFLIYFPSLDKYLAATDVYSRLGFPTPFLVGGDGLFIKETQIGELKTGFSKVKALAYTSHVKSSNDIQAEVTFNAISLLPTIKLVQSFTGYHAYYRQPPLPYLDDEKKKLFLEELSKFLGKETIVKSVSLTGDKPEDILVKPMIITSQIEAPSFIEQAGNKVIFKVGELIGPQDELYDDKARTMDGEIAYAHSFKRTLKINLPEGYHLQDCSALNMKKEFKVDGKPVSSFISKYTLNGNILTIDIYEDYEVLVYPLANYQEWRSVINASADFNKQVIVLEK